MSLQEHPLWEEELMAYLDGELDVEGISRITEHLNVCQDCSSAVADAQRLSQQMATWKVEEPSKELDDPVLAELQSESPVRRREPLAWWTRRGVWAYGLGGAAVALLVTTVAIPSLLRSRQAAPTDMAFDIPAGHLGRFEVEREAPGSRQTVLGQQGQRGQQGQFDVSLRKLQSTEQANLAATGPLVIRTARLTAITKDFDGARTKIEAIVREHQGYLDHLTVRGEARSGRGLTATLRLPSDRIDAGLKELRSIGTVQEESQNSSDVTSQVVDLRARLTNSRNTERRLLNLLRERTGDLSDVLNAEREVARVREEIERMDAQQKDILNKVQYAAIQVELIEEYHARIETALPSAGTQLQNAMIDGYHGVTESVLGFALFALRYGPILLLWTALVVPVALLLRRLHRVRLS